MSAIPGHFPSPEARSSNRPRSSPLGSASDESGQCGAVASATPPQYQYAKWSRRDSGPYEERRQEEFGGTALVQVERSYCRLWSISMTSDGVDLKTKFKSCRMRQPPEYE